MEAIDRLLTEYGATAQDMEKSPADKKRLLLEYLDEFPAFIIADDIDTVLEDDEVVSLFTHEIPHTQSCVYSLREELFREPAASSYKGLIRSRPKNL